MVLRQSTVVTVGIELEVDQYNEILLLLEQIQEPDLTNFCNDAIIHYTEYWQARLLEKPPTDNND